MSPDTKLIYMANQIATFFESQPEGQRASGIANHINDFWSTDMRERLLELVESGEATLSPMVLKAAGNVKPPRSAA
ncbi:formate dehydrogenase subunit delta [Amaricoccus macauensis]|uniref:formate dehydrogenase subunit delta n=1 Tax=Amaricoccus macauensis TaxID=57001 RepID=UPI003C7E99C1